MDIFVVKVCLKKRKNERGPLENKCGNFRPFPETNLKKYFAPTKLSNRLKLNIGHKELTGCHFD